MPYPSAHILDLTSLAGTFALSKLGVACHDGQSGFWPGLLLTRSANDCQLDWDRPGRAQAQVPNPHSASLIVLVGPGALHLLKQFEGMAKQISCPICLLVMPNAVVEELYLRSPQVPWGSAAQVLHLPSSDPQALWLVLLEHLYKLPLAASQGAGDPRPLTGETRMASNLNQSMNAAMSIDGALAAALVDLTSGMCLAQAGGGFNLDLAAAGNTEVVRAKLKTVESLGLRKGIEDILITLVDQYHLIRLIPNNPGLFLYLVLDKNKGNLALARYKLMDIERELKV